MSLRIETKTAAVMMRSVTRLSLKAAKLPLANMKAYF
jgi:hypothetical protein